MTVDEFNQLRRELDAAITLADSERNIASVQRSERIKEVAELKEEIYKLEAERDAALALSARYETSYKAQREELAAALTKLAAVERELAEAQYEVKRVTAIGMGLDEWILRLLAERRAEQRRLTALVWEWKAVEDPGTAAVFADRLLVVINRIPGEVDEERSVTGRQEP